MKRLLRAVLPLLLCLSLFLLLIPAAFAKGTQTSYGNDTIVGFDSAGFPKDIDLDHKYALIELKKQFPAELTIYLGGTVTYETDESGIRSISRIEGYSALTVDVVWECLENYDEDMDVFHFVPVLDEYALADELALPVIHVNILGELELPVLVAMPVEKSGTWTTSDNAVFESSPDSGISYYNGFENGILPPVRDQNPYGSCWAFSTIACLEADLIHDGYAGTDIDLSELHLAYYTYHDYYDEKGCNVGDNVTLGSTGYLDLGGNAERAGLRMANLVGPVLESTAPYSNAYSHPFVPELAKSSNVGQLAGMYHFDPHDISAVKSAILDHGAASISVCIYDSPNNPRQYYSSSNNSFYCPYSHATNHAVTLVGWDDNFSRNNFRTDLDLPDGNGAWLVRNSWGENSNDFGGYFWMSYYDKSLNHNAYAFDIQPGQYQHCYAYDNSPASSYYTLPGGLNISQTFRIDGGEQVEAIGFYNGTPGVEVNFVLTCGSESVTTTAYFSQSGYYLVPLSQALPISSYSDVTATFTFNTDNNVTVYIENGNTTTYSDGSLAYQYTAACGSSGMSIPHYNLGDPHDTRIKLFTNDSGAVGIAIDKARFPDDSFRSYVSANFDTDSDGYLSDDERSAVTNINVSGTLDAPGTITSLTGIEYFQDLKSLACSGNRLTALDLSQNKALEFLMCGIMDNDGNVFGNQLKTLDLSQNKALKYLYCTHNQISGLDLRNNPELLDVFCYNNALTSLNITGCAKLNRLICANNTLSTLNVSSNTGLGILLCNNNSLTALHVKNHPSLTIIDCRENALGTLDLSGCTSLTELFCQNCGLTSLNVTGCTQLKQVGCAENTLTSLDFSTCTDLRDLGCQDNRLTSLNVSGCVNLVGIGCRNNNLQSLDLSSCSNIYTLICNNNAIAGIDISNCPFLVYAKCASVPSISNGIAHYSTNKASITCDDDMRLLVRNLLELPADIDRIEEEAFSGGAYVYVNIPEGPVSIGPRAFADCPNLFYVFTHNGTEIASDAFVGSDPSIINIDTLNADAA